MSKSHRLNNKAAKGGSIIKKSQNGPLALPVLLLWLPFRHHVSIFSISPGFPGSYPDAI